MVWDNFESTLPAFQQGETLPLYTEEERARLNDLFWSWAESRKGKGRLLVTCRPSKAAVELG
jgi:hypothetical protein